MSGLSGRGKAALAMLGVVLLVAALAGAMSHGPTAVRTDHGIEVLRAPSAHHWLGTDDRGRDVAARLAYGARTSLAVAIGALTLALAIGTALGAAAAVRRGVVEQIVVGGCDLVGAVPALLVVIALQGLVGRASYPVIILLISVPAIAYVARVARAEILRALEASYVVAARSVGATDWRVLWRHALPQAMPQLAVAGALVVSSSVLSEAALTFLGFGVPTPAASWGELLREAHQNGLVWWLAVPAGVAVAIVTLAANVLADEFGRTK